MVAQQAVMREWCLLGGGAATTMQNSIIVTLIEVLNIIAHIGCGWVADQPEVSVLVVNYIALMMAGLDTMIFPFYTEYWSFLVFFVLFSIGVVWRYSGSRW
uniref:Uncharacterized protein n=2 Tax=Caenorhabditis japonica TaxID=281687 RepID=A0A8R1IZW9_CAEJA